MSKDPSSWENIKAWEIIVITVIVFIVLARVTLALIYRASTALIGAFLIAGLEIFSLALSSRYTKLRSP